MIVRPPVRASHTHTALSQEGEAFVAARTPEWYSGFMDEWERLINEYVATLSSAGDA